MAVTWITSILIAIFAGYLLGHHRGSRWMKTADAVADLLREMVWQQPGRKRARRLIPRANEALRQYERLHVGGD